MDLNPIMSVTFSKPECPGVGHMAHRVNQVFFMNKILFSNFHIQGLYLFDICTKNEVTIFKNKITVTVLVKTLIMQKLVLSDLKESNNLKKYFQNAVKYKQEHLECLFWS